MEAEVQEIRRSFWRGRVTRVTVASRDRVAAPDEVCPGCDWAHFEAAAAREAKRALFLETQQRIGKIDPGAFGELPIVPSAPRYRIRNRFHLEGRGPDFAMGQFAARSHRVEPVVGCRALSERTAALLPALRDAVAATGAAPSELATLEDRTGETLLARALLPGPKRQARSDAEALVGALSPLLAGVKAVDSEGRLLSQAGESRLTISAGGRDFSVSADTFFQGNRHLLDRLLADVGQATTGAPAEALDAFGGVGFFAAALLGEGHDVVSVEGSASAVRDAAKTRLGWTDAGRWKVVPSSVAGFLSSSSARFDLVVADPPRAGLSGIARPLAARARRRFVYVSCDPATLARDLPEILAEGFRIADARLYDLFPLTHRVEAVVTLARGARETA